ncbi:RidA family protein [Nannocystis bainbridge]|uniref:RidA family protein n=1 Tax=Nannocystis bainbridge TaxID=2995303 RepID=A0ABT5DWY6_9BACT|nr:RidA family protein [Nannocystis bainbridge]MDC0717243.1 RidA family protein [Nannocystis bainbridge]
MSDVVRTVISTPDAPAAIGPYSQGIVVSGGRTLYTAGQIPLDPQTMQIVDGDIKAQTERVMLNLAAILRAAGMDFASVVRCGIFLKDMKDFAAVNEIYGRHFGDHRPARSTVAVATLPKDVLVEIDAIAVG